MTTVLAFDVGGSKIAYAVVDQQGHIIGEVSKISTPSSAQAIEDFFSTTIAENYAQIDGVAFATAGAVDRTGSRITSFTGNLPQGYNQIEFTRLTNKPVLVENDANAAAWAEYILGASRGTKNNITLAIGTGIGAGIIIDGCLLKGKSGAAGEMHFPIDSGHKRRCQGCGQYDCFESFASGTGMKTTAQEIIGPQATTYDVINGQKIGDSKAQQVFDIWQDCLIKGLIMLGNIFDPEKIVLAGSMAQFVEYTKVEQTVNHSILTQPLQLCCSQLDNNAALLGAALCLLPRLS